MFKLNKQNTQMQLMRGNIFVSSNFCCWCYEYDSRFFAWRVYYVFKDAQ